MKKSTIVLTLILSLAVITGCEKQFSTEQKADYQKLEEQLKDVAEEYFDNNPHLVPTETGDSMDVQITWLYKGKYLTEKLVDPITKEECDENNSTITITKEEKGYSYNSYLECGEYKTEVK